MTRLSSSRAMLVDDDLSLLIIPLIELPLRCFFSDPEDLESSVMTESDSDAESLFSELRRCLRKIFKADAGLRPPGFDCCGSPEDIIISDMSALELEVLVEMRR